MPKTPGVRIKRHLDELGPDYHLETSDSENVICRKINDCYKLELSGLDIPDTRKTYRAYVYVFYTGPRGIPPTVERTCELKYLEETRTSPSRACQNSPMQWGKRSTSALPR